MAAHQRLADAPSALVAAHAGGRPGAAAAAQPARHHRRAPQLVAAAAAAAGRRVHRPACVCTRPRRPRTADRSSSRTSSSPTWVKSPYQGPTARKPGGRQQALDPVGHVGHGAAPPRPRPPAPRPRRRAAAAAARRRARPAWWPRWPCRRRPRPPTGPRAARPGAPPAARRPGGPASAALPAGERRPPRLGVQARTAAMTPGLRPRCRRRRPRPAPAPRGPARRPCRRPARRAARPAPRHLGRHRHAAPGQAQHDDAGPQVGQSPAGLWTLPGPARSPARRRRRPAAADRRPGGR